MKKRMYNYEKGNLRDEIYASRCTKRDERKS